VYEVVCGGKSRAACRHSLPAPAAVLLVPYKPGRGEPLSLTLSFGDIPWFDVRGDIQRCDWLKRTHSLEIHAGHIQKNAFYDQAQQCVSPRTLNHGISPKDSVSDQTVVDPSHKQSSHHSRVPLSARGSEAAIDQSTFSTLRTAVELQGFGFRYQA
jgi:hypothetical protein